MPNDLPKKPRFRAVIDLTSKAQEAAKAAANPPAPPETHDESAAGLDTSIASLSPTMQAAVRAAGWPGLMPVQARTLPYMQAGRDLIVQSKTGSGKTGAFLLPLFETLDPAKRGAKALVLTPTRELARQIYEEFLRLKGDRPEVAELDAVLVYGGVGYGEQTTGLKGGAQLVIGTPGRILDHLERRTLSLDGLKTLVLDEADEMLSMGFLPAMNKLRRYLPDRRQSTMFSATMPPTVRRLAETFLTDPTFIALAGGSVQVDQLAHRYYVVPGMGKDRTLVRLIELENPETAILFANTKREVEYLAQFLRNYGHDAGELSGDLSQSAREAIMQRLRDGNLRFLVATDVAARGIDISDLTHVIQYDVPQDPEYYVHRAGRTARAGKTGVSITLTTAEDKNKLLAIARRYELDFEERPLPTDEEVTARVGERLTTVLEDRYRDTRTLARERAARFDPLVKALAEEEPHLLSMLLDGLYHDGLHAKPQEELNRLAATRAQERRDRDDEERGRGPRGRHRSDEPRREERRRDEPRERRSERTDERTDETTPAADYAAPQARAPRAEHDEMPSARFTDDTPGSDRSDDRDTSAAEGEANGEGAARPAGEASASTERRSRSRGRNRRRGSDTPANASGDASGDDAAATEAPAVSAGDTGATTEDAAPFDAVWAEPSAPEPMETASVALDAIAPPLDGDEAAQDAPAARSGRRRSRGRGRNAEASPENADATPERDDATSEPSDAAPDAAPSEAQATSADATSTATPPKPKRKPQGPFSVFDLRAMSDDALRGVGEDLLDTVPQDRSDLLFAILDAQAIQESAARARRAKEAKPSGKSSGRNGRRGERSPDRSGDRPSRSDAGKADAGSPDAARADAAQPSGTRPGRAQTPRADARVDETGKPAAAAEGGSSRTSSSRKRRRRKADAPALTPLAPEATAAAPSPVDAPAAPPAADAPKKPARSRSKKADAVAAEAPTPEAAPDAAAPARRGRAKKADATPAAEASAAVATPDAAPAPAKRTRAKKADAPVEEVAPAEVAPKKPARARKAEAAPAVETAPAETAPKKPSRARKAEAADEADASDAPKRPRARKATSATEAAPSTDATEAPARRSRARKTDPAQTNDPE